MNTNDADLIQRILDGDEGAFTALVNKYQKPVHALVWRKIGDFHTAEEITQDVFLKVYKRLSTLKRRDHFPGWLYVIATRHCIAWLRKKQLPTKSLDAMSTTELEEICYAQYEADRDEEAAIEHRRELVKRLLQKLPESERTVVTLYYLAEMTGEEISVFLGISPSTVRSRLLARPATIRKGGNRDSRSRRQFSTLPTSNREHHARSRSHQTDIPFREKAVGTMGTFFCIDGFGYPDDGVRHAVIVPFSAALQFGCNIEDDCRTD